MSDPLRKALELIANAENSALDLAYCKGVARAALAQPAEPAPGWRLLPERATAEMCWSTAINPHDAAKAWELMVEAAPAARTGGGVAQPAELVAWHNPRADALRSALVEIAATKNLTATSAQFARWLQRRAAEALTDDAMAEPAARTGSGDE